MASAPILAEARAARMLLVRRSATVAAALVIAVIVASAYLRLAQSGLGCADWPACYGAVKTWSAPGAEPLPLGTAVRIAHRIAAAGVGFAVILIAALCFTGRESGHGPRWSAGALVALTVFLAMLGRVTPELPLPAVTLGNLLGGMVMLGLLWWLRFDVTRTRLDGAAVPGGWCVWAGLALVSAQIALGAAVSAFHAAASCAGVPECDGRWWPAIGALALLDPWHAAAFRSGTELAADPARAALHLTHRLGAVIVTAWWIVLAVVSWRGRVRTASAATVTAGILLAQSGVGAATVHFGLPLPLAVVHNALGAFAVLAAVSALVQSRSADAAAVSAACQIVTSK